MLFMNTDLPGAEACAVKLINKPSSRTGEAAVPTLPVVEYRMLLSDLIALFAGVPVVDETMSPTVCRL